MLYTSIDNCSVIELKLDELLLEELITLVTLLFCNCFYFTFITLSLSLIFSNLSLIITALFFSSSMIIVLSLLISIEKSAIVFSNSYLNSIFSISSLEILYIKSSISDNIMNNNFM